MPGVPRAADHLAQLRHPGASSAPVSFTYLQAVKEGSHPKLGRRPGERLALRTQARTSRACSLGFSFRQQEPIDARSQADDLSHIGEGLARQRQRREVMQQQGARWNAAFNQKAYYPP
jgi:hypothetical protein